MSQFYIIDVFEKDSKELEIIRSAYKESSFSSGKMTTTLPDKKIETLSSTKNNLEMDVELPDPKSPMYLHYWSRTPYGKCCDLIIKAVKESEIFDATLMNYQTDPIFSRYTEGAFYDTHVDTWKMGDIRTDYSVTIFISNPEDYDGGELCIDIGSEELKYKLQPGQAIVYPTGIKHRVNKVTRGTRDVCVFWIESAVSDERIRNIYRSIYKIHHKYVYEPNAIELINSECFALEHEILRKFSKITNQ